MMVHVEMPNGKDPVSRKLIYVLVGGWILLELAVLIFVCLEIARIV